LFFSCVHIASIEPEAEEPVKDASRLAVLDSALEAKDFQQAKDLWFTSWSINPDLQKDLLKRQDALLALYDEQIARSDKAKDLAALHQNKRAILALGERSETKGNYAAYGNILEDLFNQEAYQIISLFGPEEIPDKALLQSYQEKAREKLKSQVFARTPSQALDATVTLWIDRGLKMTKGLALPDRVVGSGFFVDKGGFIVSNYHVISSEVDPQYKGYSKLYVRLKGRETEKIPARVIGWNKDLDLALIKAELEAPCIIDIADADNEVLQPGERVFALGSPGGLQNTLTSGVVSSTGRRFLTLGEVIQIDAAVNPGNSGGPLVNENGVFKGLVFAGIEDFEGVNFALHARYIKHLLPSLALGGRLEIPYLGLQLSEYRNQLIVNWVAPGSSAWKSGLKPGDCLNSLNGKKPRSLIEAQDALLELSAGMVYQVTYSPSQGGKILDLNFADEKSVLLLSTDRPEYPLDSSSEAGFSASLLPALFGFSAELVSLNPLNLKLQVSEVLPGSLADENGFSPGDTLEVRDWQYHSKEHVVVFTSVIERRSYAFLASAFSVAALTNSADFL